MAQTQGKTHFWLRAEVKALEQRTALTPKNAASLISEGLAEITVERSTDRCFKDEEYAAVGCTLVEPGTWTQAPSSAVILGLKELPEDTTPLSHNHIFFGHCFKNQRGGQELLRRFASGNGTLYDLEFLVDETGRRVAAFGRSAGFVGMAVGLQAWSRRQLVKDSETDAPLPPLTSYPSSSSLVEDTCNQVKQTGRAPSVLVIGAKGRVGRGAVEFAQLLDIQPVQWDLEETARGGPFPEILGFELVVNCICIFPGVVVPPFITRELLDRPERKTVVLNDISCDFTNPNNPLPVYSEGTDFDRPTIRVIPAGGASGTAPALDVIAIDHLPSLNPVESSDEFSDAMLPHFRAFAKSDVWSRALKLFQEKRDEATSSV